MLRVFGIAGSLREGSYNHAALRAAAELMPDEMKLDIYEDLGAVPLYNPDVEAAGIPQPVRDFRAKIEAADALLFATPEYNYGIPGVLKNAIDWASRPPRKSPLYGKPAAIMGVTSGKFGTVRAQLHLRDMCLYNNMLAVTKVEVLIMEAAKKFDQHGRLVDEESRNFVRQLMEALAELVHMVQGCHRQPVGVGT